MGQNDHLFMYVDKSKILPWIDKQLNSEDALNVKEVNTAYIRGYCDALGEVRLGIKIGLWDWQQGS